MDLKLTKANLIEIITEKNGYTKKQTSDIFEALLEITKSTLASGEDILISGFGKFCVKDKAERMGRKSATDDSLPLADTRLVTSDVLGNCANGSPVADRPVEYRVYSSLHLVIRGLGNTDKCFALLLSR